MPARAADPSTSAGFTLIEVVVALVILSTILLAFYEFLSSALASGDRARTAVASYDRGQNASFMKEQMTLMVSLASAHYRVGYLSAWGLNWYVNLEQVFDMNANRAGSQIGLSFSTK